MDANVKRKFAEYPKEVRPILMDIRKVILDVAKEDGAGEVTETLKWGEPSYTTKYGSAVRFDWKPKHPDQYALYFHCQTMLVETFREVFGDLFTYEGNRAIVFGLDEKIPRQQLKRCISMALRYKKIKNLPLLGA